MTVWIMAQSDNHTLVFTTTDSTGQFTLILYSFYSERWQTFHQGKREISYWLSSLPKNINCYNSWYLLFPAQVPLIKKSHTFYYYSKTLPEAWKHTGSFIYLYISVKFGVLLPAINLIMNACDYFFIKTVYEGSVALLGVLNRQLHVPASVFSFMW